MLGRQFGGIRYPIGTHASAVCDCRGGGAAKRRRGCEPGNTKTDIEPYGSFMMEARCIQHKASMAFKRL